MRIVSVNVGMPREVTWRGGTHRTGIFKEPVSGPIRVGRLGLRGDGQANRKFHGGVDKAVYAYAVEHYEFWRSEMPGLVFPFGAFGENLTVEGLLEDTVHIGDRFRVGTVELEAAEPRLPCRMLRVRFDNDEIEDRFLESRRTGIYFRVIREGVVQQGGVIEVLHRDSTAISIAELTRVRKFDRDDRGALEQILQADALSGDWRRQLNDQLHGS